MNDQARMIFHYKPQPYQKCFLNKDKADISSANTWLIQVLFCFERMESIWDDQSIQGAIFRCDIYIQIVILDQLAFTCSKLIIESLDQGVKYVQS